MPDFTVYCPLCEETFPSETLFDHLKRQHGLDFEVMEAASGERIDTAAVLPPMRSYEAEIDALEARAEQITNRVYRRWMKLKIDRLRRDTASHRTRELEAFLARETRGQ